ncbi:DUF6580 family putative transport protein [Acidipila sp. EB88]|uniref:DUF6580 family putative transport protein n=1 Tax=Acidipila sp. EB88 TaxID=2305226 RepID=UPI000F5DA1D4|nr:DUF6580 family putative transport protein [Acidipila sp. EB88]RRA48344.1 hypothetical protein D1Y84_08640 [Acidipila sp. EB88]
MLPVILLLAAFCSHVLPHPWWNFTAVGASLLVWGGRRPARLFWPSALLPVALLAAGDYYLTRVVYGFPFHLNSYLLTWAWYALVIVLGYLLLRGRPGFARVAGSAVLASTSFFAVSNYAVWAAPGSWYPHTLAGLEACYTLALPFYRNDLLSTLVVVGAVFGLPALVARTAHTPATPTRA